LLDRARRDQSAAGPRAFGGPANEAGPAHVRDQIAQARAVLDLEMDGEPALWLIFRHALSDALGIDEERITRAT
jgi:hypothetical protein